MTFVFFLSAFLLTSLIILKLWELRQQKVSWPSRALASQDIRLKTAIVSLYSKLPYLKGKSKRFFYTLLPKLLETHGGQLKTFTVENLLKMKDNVRGKYKKFRSSKPTSNYLREISKAKTEQEGRDRLPSDK